LVAAIILLHLASHFELTFVVNQVISITGVSVNLAPFPFDPQFLILFQRFLPANSKGDCHAPHVDHRHSVPQLGGDVRIGNSVGPSIPARQPRLRTTLLPIVDLKQAHCSVATLDDHLVQRCLSRRFRSLVVPATDQGTIRSVAAPALPAWRCPMNETPLAGTKYDTQEWRSCFSGRGSTGKDVGSSLRCVAVVIGESLQIQPGSSVLEWGSGCGWMLTWLHTLFGTHGFAIDASTPAIAWTRRFSAASSCLWSGTDLSWVPDSAFHHVISYAALYHLETQGSLCNVIRQLLKKLRPGGHAWFGANQVWGGNWAFTFSEQQWRRCLQRKWSGLNISFAVNFVHDSALFRSHVVDFGELPADFLFYAPAFSVFAKRLT